MLDIFITEAAAVLADRQPHALATGLARTSVFELSFAGDALYVARALGLPQLRYLALDRLAMVFSDAPQLCHQGFQVVTWFCRHRLLLRSYLATAATFTPVTSSAEKIPLITILEKHARQCLDSSQLFLLRLVHLVGRFNSTTSLRIPPINPVRGGEAVRAGGGLRWELLKRARISIFTLQRPRYAVHGSTQGGLSIKSVFVESYELMQKGLPSIMNAVLASHLESTGVRPWMAASTLPRVSNSRIQGIPQWTSQSAHISSPVVVPWNPEVAESGVILGDPEKCGVGFRTIPGRSWVVMHWPLL
ncbi:hypothetical protein BP5796_01440 [Coleophoma crateriformis]|uniref:Uncharacterized protein n=1 Tax=Coleophoma crateriformis TaxID=565419 RepID=A0A3D8T0G3_9HELO|nr:hypothetical protein BP5796_01440 [Coleophoma crateriformis]